MYVCDCVLSEYFEFVCFVSSIVADFKQNDLYHLTIYLMQFKEIVAFLFNLKNNILYKILKLHLYLCKSFLISLQRRFSEWLKYPHSIILALSFKRLDIKSYDITKCDPSKNFTKKNYYPVKVY